MCPNERGNEGGSARAAAAAERKGESLHGVLFTPLYLLPHTRANTHTHTHTYTYTYTYTYTSTSHLGTTPEVLTEIAHSLPPLFAAVSID